MEHDHHQQKYTCPMHSEIVQDGPGKCPVCGMNLVPIEKQKEQGNAEIVDLRKMHHQHDEHKPTTGHAGRTPGETITLDLNSGAQGFQKYTCPMHPQIVQDGPGKCPLCGMTLVPLTRPGSHDGHQSHAGGVADFKKRFYVVLALTIPSCYYQR